LGEAGLGEGRCVVGEVGGAEVGQDAEGQVEGTHEDAGRKMHGAGGDAEVGDEPEGAGGEGGGETCDQGFELGLGEAVEEEVSDDEVVFFFFGRRGGEVQDVGVVSGEAGGGVGGGCFAVAAQEMEHGGAGVDGVGAEVRVLPEELGEEAAVSVSYDQSAFLLEEVGEIVEAAAFEGSAEGEVLEPAIRAGYEIEISFVGAG